MPSVRSLINGIACSPSITGIARSSTIASGRTSAATSTAWAPSLASPTTVKRSSVDKASRSKCRISSVSSARTTEMAVIGARGGRGHAVIIRVHSPRGK